MTFLKKINDLKAKIHEALIPLVDHDYVLWDLPYHNNIGDILIWQGELDFLREVNYKCLGFASRNTCFFPLLSQDTVILLHGGGNFGDIWRECQEFRLEVIRRYPCNKIIILPHTVWYESDSLLADDVQRMAVHKNLIICARDQVSYSYLKAHFCNEILLVPDMAFYIPIQYISSYRVKESEKILFLKRTDKELRQIKAFNLPLGDLETHDWPAMERKTLIMYGFSCIGRGRRFFSKFILLSFITRLFAKLTDFYAINFFRPDLVRQGIRFISSYKMIYTTRLHALILAVLLEKQVFFLDNSYGKNQAFYDTWLKDLDMVSKYDEDV